MTVRVEKPSVNLREKLAELDKPTGIAGEAMLRAETPQEQFNLIGAGRKNLIINGAQNVSQRGTSVSISTSANTFLTDRFFSRIQGSAGTATASQVSDAPTGFVSSLKITVGTADTSLGAADYTRIHQDIEGYTTIGTGWGTNSGVPVTLSFWVKSSIAGEYSIGVYNSDASRSFVKEYTIDAADTWEYKTITIPPNNGTWVFDNGYGIRVSFSLGSGATYTCAESNLGVWPSTFDFSSPNNVNLMATSGATFQITGVQLELGKVATPFEHRSYGEELALCQRYYEEWSGNKAMHPQYSSEAAGSYAAAREIWNDFKVEKRANPSVTVTGTHSPSAVNASVYGLGAQASEASSTASVRISAWTADAEL